MIADRLFLCYEAGDAQSVAKSIDSNEVKDLLGAETFGSSIYSRRFCTFGIAKYWLGTAVLRNGLALRLAQIAIQDFISGGLDQTSNALSEKQVADLAKKFLGILQVDPTEQLIRGKVVPRLMQALEPQLKDAERSPQALRSVLEYLRGNDPATGFLKKPLDSVEQEIREDLAARFVLPLEQAGDEETYRNRLAGRYWRNAYWGSDEGNDVRTNDIKNTPKDAVPGPEELVLFFLDKFGAENAACVVQAMVAALAREAGTREQEYDQRAKQIQKDADQRLGRWEDALAITPNILGTREEAVEFESGEAAAAARQEAGALVHRIAAGIVSKLLNSSSGRQPAPAGVMHKMFELVNRVTGTLQDLLKAPAPHGLDAALVEFFRTGHASERYRSPVLDKLRKGSDQFIQQESRRLLYFALFGQKGQDQRAFKWAQSDDTALQRLVMYVRQMWFEEMQRRNPAQLLPLDLAFERKRVDRDQMIQSLQKVCFELSHKKPDELTRFGRKALEFAGLRDVFKGRSAVEFLIAEDPEGTLMRDLPDLAKPYGALDTTIENIKANCGGKGLLILKDPKQADKLKPLRDKFGAQQDAFKAQEVSSRTEDSVTLVYERAAIPLPALLPVQELEKWHLQHLQQGHGSGLYLFEDRPGAAYSTILPELVRVSGAREKERRERMADALLAIFVGIVQWGGGNRGGYRIDVTGHTGFEKVTLGPTFSDVVRAACGTAKVADPRLVRKQVEEGVSERLAAITLEQHVVLQAVLKYVRKFYCVTEAAGQKANRAGDRVWEVVLNMAIDDESSRIRANWPDSDALNEKGVQARVVNPWLDLFVRFVGPRPTPGSKAVFRMLPTIDPHLDTNVIKENREVHRKNLALRVPGLMGANIEQYTSLSPAIDDNGALDEIDPNLLEAWKKAPEDPAQIPAHVRDFVEKVKAAGRSQ